MLRVVVRNSPVEKQPPPAGRGSLLTPTLAIEDAQMLHGGTGYLSTTAHPGPLCGQHTRLCFPADASQHLPHMLGSQPHTIPALTL